MTDIQLQSGELWEIDGERHFFDQAMGSGFLLFRSERTGGRTRSRSIRANMFRL